MNNKKRTVISLEDAIAKLPDGDYVHTFRQAGFALIGADWDKNDLITAMSASEVELAGPQAAAMKHGIAFRDNFGFVFVATKPHEAQ